jgi:hypothetical protein
MSQRVRSAFFERRFPALTLLICAHLLAAPLIAGNWPIQMLL